MRSAVSRSARNFSYCRTSRSEEKSEYKVKSCGIKINSTGFHRRRHRLSAADELGLKEPRLLIDVTKLPESRISSPIKKYRSARRRRSRRSPKTPMS
ncbi:MAG: hypothetical protein ACLUEQ_12070 [Cloacibacillus evryensis]